MDDDDDKADLPIGEVLVGMKMLPLPDGEIPEWAFVLIKTNAGGWYTRATAPPSTLELLGALATQVKIYRRDLVEEWELE